MKRVYTILIGICSVLFISGCERRGDLLELEERKKALLQQVQYLQNEAQRGINTGQEAFEIVNYNLTEAQKELVQIQESIAKIKQASRFDLSPNPEYEPYEY